MLKISQMAPTDEVDKDTEVPILHKGMNFRTRLGNILNLIAATAGGWIEKDEIKTLDYLGLQTSDRFDIDTIEINQAMFNGGYYKPTSKPIGVPYVATTQFNFWTLSSQPVMFPPVRKLASNQIAIPLVGVNTMSYDVPFIRSDFVGTQSHERAFTHFTFDREQPAHGVLQGTLEVCLRVSKESNPRKVIPPTVWLMLGGNVKPNFENRNAVGLAIGGATLTMSPVSLNGRDFGATGSAAMPMPTYAEALAAVENTTPLPHVVEIGKIEAWDTNEELNTPNEPKQKTSGWIDCGGSQILVMKTDGTSRASRVQWKDELGEIYYDNVQSSNPLDSNRMLFLPPSARWVRIWFSTIGDTAENLSVWKLPASMNPIDGLWAKYTFNVNAEVDFYKDVEYWFELRVFGGENTETVPEHGCFITSGGLSMNSNVKDTIQKSFEDWEVPKP